MANGKSASFAWRTSLRASARELTATGDARLAERVDDLLDLERQVLLAIDGSQAPKFEIPSGGILLARDLTPSQLVDIDTRKLAGIALAGGGPTSHVSILAATLGIPMLVAVGKRLLEIAAGSQIILNADAGDAASPIPARRCRRNAGTARTQSRARANSKPSPRRRIAISRVANASRCSPISPAPRRTPCSRWPRAPKVAACCAPSSCFSSATTAPDEDEQLRCYQQVARILGTRPLIIRTLDIGGDKPIPYLPMPPEDNPALGLRGVRTSLWRPDLFDVQLRAMLRVQPAGQVRILLPMITDVDEIRSVRSLLGEACAALGLTPPRARRHDRNAGRGHARRRHRPRSRLSLDRHQRSGAVHAGHGSRPRRTRGAHRRRCIRRCCA